MKAFISTAAAGETNLLSNDMNSMGMKVDLAICSFASTSNVFDPR
jgi:hypothetical protein